MLFLTGGYGSPLRYIRRISDYATLGILKLNMEDSASCRSGTNIADALR
jgi:hypothetical protein